MRTNIKMPRILKINRVTELSISVVFNNGESRMIDFKTLMTDLGIKEGSPAGVLYDMQEFEKVKLVNHTLSWDNVDQYISSRDGGRIKVPFEIGADVLLKYSKAENSETDLKVGKLIREARIKKGMSQQDLALVSGTSRTYISRIENNRSDIELNTLRKIIETGLGKRMEIRIK
jgi:DNA-binding XRE family transcriptional regulator